MDLIWVDGERVQSLLKRLEERGLSAGPNGKGRSCWLAYGHLLACRDCDVIALHDCDIVNYDRQLLARLCYPLAHPHLGFEFVKGYYARVTDRMHGRVTRLFMTPLLRTLEGMAPGNPFLRYLDSFRYALAGEFAMDINLARVNRIPADWGLEVGVLAEVFRNCATARTCQVDLMDNYEHKHQSLSAEDKTKGLSRMASDIAKSLLRTLAAEGVVFSSGRFPKHADQVCPDGSGHDCPLLRRRHAQRPEVRPQRGGDGRDDLRSEPADRGRGVRGRPAEVCL